MSAEFVEEVTSLFLLHKCGFLDDSEFSDAKAALGEDAEAAPAAPAPASRPPPPPATRWDPTRTAPPAPRPARSWDPTRTAPPAPRPARSWEEPSSSSSATAANNAAAWANNRAAAQPAVPSGARTSYLSGGDPMPGSSFRIPDFAMLPLPAAQLRLFRLARGASREATGWRMVSQGSLSPLRGVELTGRVSPLHSVTLSAQEREKVGIPRSAARYCWAYPVDMDALQHTHADCVSELATLDSSDPAVAFVEFGGFVYLDSREEVVWLNVVQPGSGLHFHGPLKWKRRFTRDLLQKLGQKPCPSNIRRIRDQGVRHYAWIAPCSGPADPQWMLGNAPAGQPLLAGEQRMCWADWPHGAFVYFFNDDPAQPDERDCYFRLESVSQTKSGGRFRHVQLHQRSEWQLDDQGSHPKPQVRRYIPHSDSPGRQSPAAQYRVFSSPEEAAAHERKVESERRAAEDRIVRAVGRLPADKQMQAVEWCRKNRCRYVDTSFNGRDICSRYGKFGTVGNQPCPPATSVRDVKMLSLRDMLVGGAKPTLYAKSDSRAHGHDVSDGIQPDDITQGCIQDCWVLGSFASIAEYPEMVRRCFRPEADHPDDVDLDAFVLRLCIDGWWRNIAVDGLVPWGKRAMSPKFGYNCHAKEELWVMVLEKAVAKSYATYHDMEGGDPVDALARLTGCPTEKFPRNLQRSKFQWNKPETHNERDCPEHLQQWLGRDGGGPFSRLRELDRTHRIMCIYTFDMDSQLVQHSKGLYQKHSRIGLFCGHVYTILCVAEPIKLRNPWKDIAGQRKTVLRLCRIRNPHGKGEWNGDWSDKSRLWGEHPEVEAALNASDNPAMHQNHHEDENDGLFWMDWDDVMRIFEGGGACHVRNGFTNKDGVQEEVPWSSVRMQVALGSNSSSQVCSWKVEVLHPAQSIVTLYRKDERCNDCAPDPDAYFHNQMKLEIWARNQHTGRYEAACRSNNGEFSEDDDKEANCYFKFEETADQSPYYIKWTTKDRRSRREMEPAQNHGLRDGFETGVLRLMSDSKFAVITPLASVDMLSERETPAPADVQLGGTPSVRLGERTIRKGQSVDMKIEKV